MTNARILIVEDEIIVARDIQNTLEDFGYAVPAVVSSGEEAIQKAADTRPDLVLMDIRLIGDMDGVKAAEQIRARFDIPVVYLTAYTGEDTLERAKVTEPFAYILKPFQVDELRINIEVALYKYELDKRLRESEARYRAVSELTSDFAYSFRVGSDGTLVPEWMTDAFTRITGFTPDEMERRGVWMSIVHPDDRSIVLRRLQAVLSGQPDVAELCIVTKSGGTRWLHVYSRPVWDEGQGRVVRVIGAAQDVTKRKRMEEEREGLILELQDALAKVKKLSGLLPICAHCKKIRDDKGYWNQLEAYIQEHSEAEFTHGICDECTKKLYPGLLGDDE